MPSFDNTGTVPHICCSESSKAVRLAVSQLGICLASVAVLLNSVMNGRLDIDVQSKC